MSQAQTAENATPRQTGGTTLGGAVKQWSTPQARDHKGADLPSRAGKPGLPDQVKSSTNGKSQGLWATPQTADVNYSRGSEQYKNRQREKSPYPQLALQNPKGKLNPDWVEQLMGVPVGWTDLGCWATESSPGKQKKH